MEEYKAPLSITSQFSFCGLPFRLDTYSGCSFNCTYCFARLRGGFTHSKKLRPASAKKIIIKFKNALNKPGFATGLVAEFIRNRMPVHFGGMSDPFQPIEKELKISLECLKYLASINYPVIISTKSTLLSKEPYLEVLRDYKNVLVQFSFSTTINEKSRIIEPFSNKPSEIMKTIEVLSKNGIKTTVRWQPYVPKLSESPREFIKTISSLGVYHLGFEHLKVPVEKNSPLWKRLSTNLNFDITKYYKETGCKYDGRELVLNPEYKLAKIYEVKSELKKHSITFGSADNELQFLSDTDCCCSGIDQFEEFKNWNKFQIGYAVKKSNGSNITFNLINDEWKPKGSIDKYLNSQSRIKKNNSHNTIEDYVIKRWEDLNSSFNPTSFYGVIYNGLLDENGLKVYEWDKTCNLKQFKS